MLFYFEFEGVNFGNELAGTSDCTHAVERVVAATEATEVPRETKNLKSLRATSFSNSSKPGFPGFFRLTAGVDSCEAPDEQGAQRYEVCTLYVLSEKVDKRRHWGLRGLNAKVTGDLRHEPALTESRCHTALRGEHSDRTRQALANSCRKAHERSLDVVKS